jgi:hypothetical protein
MDFYFGYFGRDHDEPAPGFSNTELARQLEPIREPMQDGTEETA